MKDTYTPIPFWFWNDELEFDEIERQIKEMKAKGVDGFIIHPRKGLPKSIEYMGETYINYVRFAVKTAQKLDMVVVLYDEAMYPSGSANGQVVKENSDFASKGLIKISKDGKEEYKMVASEGTIRGIYEGEDDGEENAPKSADLLNPLAVESFIRHTHDKYYEALEEYFGNTIIGIFTDEPCILGRNSVAGMLPWSEGFLDLLKARGFKEEWMTYLFEDDGSINSQAAIKIYKKALHDRLSESYYSQLQSWCKNHRIGLMGHPEKSTDIGFMKYFTYPCQDIVWRFVALEDEKYIKGSHSCMAKCSSDAARHRGIKRNGNECFGCCGHLDNPYEFGEADMLWYLNWLFVRGVNLIIPHAFYYSVRGDRGAERPPEVGMHNPFWPNYKKMSSYIKRMCEIITGAVNQADVAVLCNYETMSDVIARPLFENQIEFNYLEEELLPICSFEGGECQIADQHYKTLIYDERFLEEMETDTGEYLERIRKAGIRLIKYQGYDELLKELDEFRKIRLWNEEEDGSTIKNIRMTDLVKENKEFLIITNEGKDPIEFKLSIKGKRICSIENVYLNVRDELKNSYSEILIKIKACESRIVELE